MTVKGTASLTEARTNIENIIPIIPKPISDARIACLVAGDSGGPPVLIAFSIFSTNIVLQYDCDLQMALAFLMSYILVCLSKSELNIMKISFELLTTRPVDIVQPKIIKHLRKRYSSCWSNYDY